MLNILLRNILTFDFCVDIGFKQCNFVQRSIISIWFNDFFNIVSLLGPWPPSAWSGVWPWSPSSLSASGSLLPRPAPRSAGVFATLGPGPRPPRLLERARTLAALPPPPLDVSIVLAAVAVLVSHQAPASDLAGGRLLARVLTGTSVNESVMIFTIYLPTKLFKVEIWRQLFVPL